MMLTRPEHNQRALYLIMGFALTAALFLTGCAAPQAALPAAAPTTAPAQPVVQATAAATVAPTAPPATLAPEATAGDVATTEPAAPTEPAPATEPPAAPEPTATVSPAPATPRQIGLQQIAVASRPVFLTHAGDGSNRMFVVEKRGTIRILQDGALSEDFFLDIRDRVNADSSERGLLGLAFAPDYSESGHFFVNYTDASGDTVVSRFQASADPNRADPASEFIVLKIDQPAPNHNGGGIVFGPDGYLWIGTGDGGAANDRFGNGQNPATLLGKMLRLDVTTDPAQPYLIPADNPWTQADWNGKDVRDEVWSVGMRNPWRFSFDRDDRRPVDCRCRPEPVRRGQHDPGGQRRWA